MKQVKQYHEAFREIGIWGNWGRGFRVFRQNWERQPSLFFFERFSMLFDSGKKQGLIRSKELSHAMDSWLNMHSPFPVKGSRLPEQNNGCPMIFQPNEIMFPAIHSPLKGMLVHVLVDDMDTARERVHGVELAVETARFKEKFQAIMNRLRIMIGKSRFSNCIDAVDYSDRLGCIFTCQGIDDDSYCDERRIDRMKSAEIAVVLSYIGYLLRIQLAPVVASGAFLSSRSLHLDHVHEKTALVSDEFPDHDFVVLSAKEKYFIQSEGRIIWKGKELMDLVEWIIGFRKIQIPSLKDPSFSSSKSRLELYRRNYQESESDSLWNGIERKFPRKMSESVRLNVYQCHVNRAKTLQDAWRMEEALKVYQQAFKVIEGYSKCVETDYKLNDLDVHFAVLLTAMYRFSQARKVIERFRSRTRRLIGFETRDPDTLCLRNALIGECLMLARDYVAASGYFKEADRQKSASHLSRLRVYQARLAMHVGDLEQAGDYLDRAEEAAHLGGSSQKIPLLYVQCFRVKWFHLQGKFEKSFELACSLESRMKATPNTVWPGPVWRRFGGLSALRLGCRAEAETLMKSENRCSRKGDILHIHQFTPCLELIRFLIYRSRVIDPGHAGRLLSFTEMLSRPVFGSRFNPESRCIQSKILRNEWDAELNVSIGVVIAKIYE